MSARAPKHWILERANGLFTCKGPELSDGVPVEMMRVSDHEQIVAELGAKDGQMTVDDVLAGIASESSIQRAVAG